jgi:CheY-like chemotaxis protein
LNQADRENRAVALGIRPADGASQKQACRSQAQADRWPAGTSTAASGSDRMEDKRNFLVLVVDDEPMVRIVATEGLEDAGFSVIEACSAEHALALLQTRGDVGALFTDVNMPGAMDGIGLARRVHELWPGVRIVVTSGRGLPEPVPDDGRFLRKPYSVDELAHVITEAAERR